MKKLRPFIAPMVSAAALMVALPSLAMAQDGEIKTATGPYLGLSAGYNWTRDTNVNAGTALNGMDFSEGYTGILEGGYRFDNGLRPALEVGYSTDVVDNITGGPAGRFGSGGNMNALTIMGVVNYDFHTGTALRPYVGAGVGLARLHLERVGALSAPGVLYDDWDSAFAWQVGAGFSYAVAPDMDVTVGYRYLDTDKGTFKAAGQRAKTDYSSHTALIGVRYVFGQPEAKPVATTTIAPPPPPPPPPPAPVAQPAPAPAITRNFTVFFDFDKATLSADAQSVLQNVARDAKAGKVVNITVSGHADTSGSAQYNQQISQRRAEAVREYLLSQGLGSAQISVEAKGETDLLVPTADNVREPSNRRAVIIFPEGQPNS